MISPRILLLKEMLEKEPEDSFLNYVLALEYAKINEADKAISIISAVLQKDKNYLAAYYQLGKLYEQTGLIKEAINTYKAGVYTAKEQNNLKTLGELNEALMILEEE